MSLQTPLEMLYKNAKSHPNEVYLKQPVEGKITDYTWSEFDSIVRRLATGLKKFGLPQGSRVALLSKNCAEWIMADTAILLAGYVSVPIFPTAGEKTIRFILEHAECSVMFVGKLDEFQQSCQFIPEGVNTIGFPYENDCLDHRWQDFIACEPFTESPCPKLEETMTIVYTSGSTGAPKGVLHTYGSISWAAKQSLLPVGVNANDRVLSYLPLAHITERVLGEFASFYSRVEISFVESLDTFPRDIKACSPTLFLSVPRLWTLFQMGVLKQIPQKKLDFLLKMPLIRRLVSRKIRENMGLNQARLWASGSAPLSPATIKWFHKVGINISEGWGMTETCAFGTSCVPFDIKKAGSIGKPYDGVDIRIADDGEIQIKGKCNMKEYYLEPEKTAEVFTSDGYLRTGDRGKIDNDGYVTITGRLKDIFKTAKGKYVSPAPIEARLMESTLIEQVCVTGNNLKQPIALLVLSGDAASQEKEYIRAELKIALENTNATLESHQVLEHLVVMKDNWTVENDLLTPTLKVKRHMIEDRFASVISANYKDKVIWQS